MFSKKVKEIRDLDDEIFYLERKVNTCISDLNHSVKSEFKKALRRKLDREVRVRFESLQFGSKKKKREPAELIVEYTDSIEKLMTFNEFTSFCNECSEKFGICIKAIDRYETEKQTA